MKAVILAAGKGTRMLPLTKEVPKVLVEVEGKPFLYYVIKSLQKAGFEEFGIVVGYKKEKISDFLKKYGFKAELIEQKEQLGTGHAVMLVKKFVKEEDFIVYYGDGLFEVEDLKQFGKVDEFNYACGIRVSDPSKYGVFIVNRGLLKEIKEKPKEFVGNIVSTGLYKFKPEIFKALEGIKKSGRNELELTDGVTVLAEMEKVKVLEVKKWIDLGCLDDIEKVDSFLKSNWQE